MDFFICKESFNKKDVENDFECFGCMFGILDFLNILWVNFVSDKEVCVILLYYERNSWYVSWRRNKNEIF